ncbi:REF/SRPP-like protein isoform X1 [Canna indica]|uniref:REF/SRPP-like protein isoform X1 n=1 Tax=Canna indica TaxID=4628 RepID=A0AAQ3Q316_9LILI|nr:REF/SRPP-like protein isoform X1 [Canna indica]
MADAVEKSDQINVETAEQERLRYLEFVHAAAIHAVLCVARMYICAKDSAGPLKPGVQSVEDTVKTVVGPVYDKYHGVPFELLKFVDRKVDESVQKVERRVPSVVKNASATAKTAAGEVHRSGLVGSAAGLARSVYAHYEPAAKGLYARYEPAAKEIYAKYEPAAEQAAASAWRSLNRLPLVPRVAQVVVPTAAQISEKYNKAVCSSAEKGYAVSAYLPLVPTKRIARVFAGETPAAMAH